MAGTLTISTLSDGTNSTSSTNCIQGSAKVWVDFNGNTAAIRASYNVSSVTRNSAGNYTINFTNALTDTNYCCVNGISFDGVLTGTGQTYGKNGVLSTTNFTIGTWSGGNSPTDSAYVNVAIFR